MSIKGLKAVDELISLSAKYGKTENLVNLLSQYEDKEIGRKLVDALYTVSRMYGYSSVDKLVRGLNENLFDEFLKHIDDPKAIFELYLLDDSLKLSRFDRYGVYSQDIFEKLVEFRKYIPHKYQDLIKLFENDNVFNWVTRARDHQNVISFLTLTLQYFGRETAEALADVVISSKNYYSDVSLRPLPFIGEFSEAKELVTSYGEVNPKYSFTILRNLAALIPNEEKMKELIGIYKKAENLVFSIDEVNQMDANTTLNFLYFLYLNNGKELIEVIDSLNKYLGEPKKILEALIKENEVEDKFEEDSEVFSYLRDKARYEGILDELDSLLSYSTVQQLHEKIEEDGLEAAMVSNLLYDVLKFNGVEVAKNVVDLLNELPHPATVLIAHSFDDPWYYLNLIGGTKLVNKATLAIKNYLECSPKCGFQVKESIIDALVLGDHVEETVDFFLDEDLRDIILNFEENYKVDIVHGLGKIVGSVGFDSAIKVEEILTKYEPERVFAIIYQLAEIAFHTKDGRKVAREVNKLI